MYKIERETCIQFITAWNSIGIGARFSDHMLQSYLTVFSSFCFSCDRKFMHTSHYNAANSFWCACPVYQKCCSAHMKWANIFSFSEIQILFEYSKSYCFFLQLNYLAAIVYWISNVLWKWRTVRVSMVSVTVKTVFYHFEPTHAFHVSIFFFFCVFCFLNISSSVLCAFHYFSQVIFAPSSHFCWMRVLVFFPLRYVNWYFSFIRNFKCMCDTITVHICIYLIVIR